tara:strand:- start:1492 stop:1926 length:435 start_codon:yes stop_codon:yes gene_type:complete
MSKGQSEIEALKKPFNKILKEGLDSVSVELIETRRKKKGSEEYNETEFVAVRLPFKRSEIADELDCETKNVSSLLQSASKQLTTMPKMRKAVVKLSALVGTDMDRVLLHKDVRFDCIADDRGRGPSCWLDLEDDDDDIFGSDDE